MPVTPEELAALSGELKAHELLERDAYEFGYADGFAAGWAASEADMAEHWATLARRVRQTANRLKRPAAVTEHADAA